MAIKQLVDLSVDGSATLVSGKLFLTANNYAIENVGGNYGVRNSSGNYGGNDGTNAYTTPQDFFHIPGNLRVGPKYATSDRDYIKLIPAGSTSTIEMPNENAYIHNNAGNIVLRTGASTDAVTVSGANTTFAGNVTIGDTGVNDTRSLTLQTNSEQNTVINLKEASANYGFSLVYNGTANDFIIKRHDNNATGVDVLTLNRSDNDATFAGNIVVSKTDPTITLIDSSGANTDPNGKIVFSELSGHENFDINYNGAADRLEFRGKVGNTDNTDLVLINRDLTTTLQVLGGAVFDSNIKYNGELQVFSGSTDIGQISNSGGALNVQGTSTRDVSLGSDTNPQALFIEGSNGRIGIGETSPEAQLHIADSSNNTSGLRFSAVGTGNQDNVNMHFQGTAGSAPFYISRAQTGGAEIQLQRDGDIILNGSNGDNTGIGTTTPQQKLHVNGNILCGGNMYFNTGTSNYISGIGGGLEWYTDSNKIVDITYNGDVEVTNDLDIGNTKLLTWGALGGTTPTTYIQGQDNGSRLFFVGNFNYDYSNSTDGNFVFKNSNNNGTTSGAYGVVMDIVTDSTATGSINTGIRFGRDKGMSNGYNKYTGSIDYISTNQTSGEKMIFKTAQYAFLQANGSPSSGLTGIKIGGNTNNQVGYIDLWGDSGGGKPFFNIQDTRYQPSTDLSNPVIRIQNNFHSTNSRYQIVFQRYGATSSIRGSIATNNSGTTYNTTSDYRLKTDAKDFNALDLVKQIPVYDFKWKNINNRDYGCFAHELNEVIPNAVNGEKDALTEDGDKDYQQADYSKIVPVLLKAIQELEAKVKILENK